MAASDSDVKIGLWKNDKVKDMWSGTNKETGQSFLLFVIRDKKNPRQPDFDLVIKEPDGYQGGANSSAGGGNAGSSPTDSDLPF